MKKPEIKKLQYPLWFRIVFLLLTVGGPIILLLVQGLNSPNKVFRFTFTVICTLLIAWIFIRKFVLARKEKDIRERKVALEHDYEIEVGNPDKIKWLWFSNEIWLTIINVIEVALIASLIALTAVGIEAACIKVKGLTFAVMTFYLVAYTIKFILLLSLRGKEFKEDEVDDERKQE